MRRILGDEWPVRLTLAIIIGAVSALSFAGVAGWIVHGEAIFVHAVAQGWAMCF